MANKFTPADIHTVLFAFSEWLTDHAADIAADLPEDILSMHSIVVADVTPGDVQKGTAVLGVFTARAALRKVITWFDQSRQWTDVERQEFLTVLVREAQDAIANCNTALYHLTGPSSAPSAIDPSLDTFLNGGDK